MWLTVWTTFLTSRCPLWVLEVTATVTIDLNQTEMLWIHRGTLTFVSISNVTKAYAGIEGWQTHKYNITQSWWQIWQIWLNVNNNSDNDKVTNRTMVEKEDILYGGLMSV